MKKEAILAAKILGVVVVGEAVGVLPWLRKMVGKVTAPKAV